MKRLTDFKSFKELRCFASKSWTNEELKKLWDDRFKFNCYICQKQTYLFINWSVYNIFGGCENGK